MWTPNTVPALLTFFVRFSSSPALMPTYLFANTLPLHDLFNSLYLCVSDIYGCFGVCWYSFIHVRSSSWRCWAVLRFGWCQKPSSFVNMPSILFLLCVRALLRIWFISAAMQKIHARIHIYIRMPMKCYACIHRSTHTPWRIYWYIHKSLSIEYMYRV